MAITNATTPMPRFATGDVVKWVSHAGGFPVKKIGMIIAVVPAGVDAHRYIPEGRDFPGGMGAPRNHETYIVDAFQVRVIGYKTCLVRRRLYWPRVSILQDAVKSDRNALSGEML